MERSKDLKIIKNNEGFGVVEVVLLIVVIIGLVIIFNEEITSFVSNVLGKLQPAADEILG